MSYKTENRTSVYSLISLGILLTLGIILWGIPNYNIYAQKAGGEAKLREAESSRQIAVLEAKAKKESATLYAEAEIERAKGVAEANRIIGTSLQGNTAYLQYLYITSLQDKDNNSERTIIYVPTEKGFNLPVLESGRLNIKDTPKVSEETDK